MQNGLPFSILVVEDDADDRIFIDEAFMKIGFAAEVKKFKDGTMMLHYLEQLEPSLYPSLIVLDNSLPGLNAVDLLRLLKNDAAYKDIRVVVYTTLLTPLKKQELFAAGAFACMEKGNNMQDLVQVASELKDLAGQDTKEL